MEPEKRPAKRSLFALLGSLKLTLLLLVVLTGVTIAVSQGAAPGGYTLAAPLFALTANLLGAVVSNPIFRRRTALLVFHLALMALTTLAGVGRLTYLKGTVEVTVGTEFQAGLAQLEHGPWHPLHLEKVNFTNDGFSIDYSPGVKRDLTHNQLHWTDENGQARAEVIGDQTPLVEYGYRFYTSPNKGFAPVFTWHPANGSSPVVGAVNLPSYPLNASRQVQEWTIPGTDLTLSTQLVFQDVILDPTQDSTFRPPRDCTVRMRYDEGMAELKPGDRFDLPDGYLVFNEVRTWMGYAIFYDWTMPWLFASCLVAVISLLLNYREKFAATSWMKAGETTDGA